MAGDWIKMRHNLETDPDVLRIAEAVGVDRFSVVGRLHAIWAWADQHSLDGCAVGATTVFLDDLVGCAGFCKALRSVGWLDGRDWQLSFPNFSRHNGETAKKRAQAKKTMAKKREKSATTVAQNAQLEKRREEKNKEPPNPQGGTSASDEEKPKPPPYSIDFETWWSNYPRRRRSKKQQAYRKWKTVTKTVDAEMLIARVRDYAKSPQGQSEYAVLPTVWLNAGMWEDAPEAWQRKSDAKTGQDDLFHSIPKVG